MGIIRKIIGPKSKYDHSIPYSYMAKEPLLEGDEDMAAYYFGDTLCSLIDHLSKQNIPPDTVELYGVYLDKDIPLKKDPCVSKNGQWLHRPHLCHSLEAYYKKTMELVYKGHHEENDCSFDDRDLKGSGPY